MNRMERLEKKIYYTYHDKKNKEILPIIIVLTLVFCIFNGGFLFQILLWSWYYYYCKTNNNKLNNDKNNLEYRERLIERKRKILNGELDKYNKHK